MRKVLKLQFKTEEGKTKVITINNPKEGLAKDVVKAAMQKIVDADVFYNEGEKVYAKVASAKYYTTQSDDIFTTEDEEETATTEAAQ